MGTTIKTSTRTVTLSLVTRETGIDYSGDYIGNASDKGLRRDPDGVVDYVADDATADWWERQCKAQQEADDALAELSADDRQRAIDAAGSTDLEDHPGAILSAIADLPTRDAAKALGARGGKARAAGMTADQRSEASRKAAQAPRPSRRKPTPPAEA